MHASLGEYRERVDELIAEGDRVAVRVTLTGVGNAGRKSVSSLGILIYRIADGRIAEQWEVGNVAGIMEQLGFAPASPLS
jgi:predicted ester cyclase